MKYADEIWRPIAGHHGIYEISSHGRVRSLDRLVKRGGFFLKKRGFLMKVRDVIGGYKNIHLRDANGVGSTHRVHRLVARHFIPNHGVAEVDHIDADPSNNMVQNLRWVDRQANVSHSVARGSFDGANNPKRARLFSPDDVHEMHKMRGRGAKLAEIADAYTTSKGVVCNILRGKTWAAVALAFAASSSAGACSWDTPGSNRTVASPADVAAGPGYGVDSETVERIRTLRYDRVVEIRKTSKLRDMSFGADGRVCRGSVTMQKWSDDHREYALLYKLPDGRNLIVAATCGNLAWLEGETTNAEANSGTDAFDPEALLRAEPTGAGALLDSAEQNGVDMHSVSSGLSPIVESAGMGAHGVASPVFGGWGGVFLTGGDTYITVINECCCDDDHPVINPPIPTPVPEPWTAAMFAAGLAVVMKARRKS